ncbi:MAG: hypothetical protein LQ352_005122, partial [Teloschistes flavicans]
MSQSFGLMIGPAIGGPLYEYGGYFVTFIPAFVLIAIEIVLRSLVVIPPRTAKGQQALTEEVEGPLLSKGTTAAKPLYGTSLLPSHIDQPEDAKPPSHRHAVDNHSTTTTISLFLTSPRILTALTALFALNTILTTYDAIIPIYIRATFAFPASTSSLLFLIMVSSFTLSPLAGVA